MSLNFEQGSQDQPRGHAILYFRSLSEVLATYIVVLPLMVDFSKYIPPFMASQVKDTGLERFSAFAIPPLPEKVESYQVLEELARARGDDVIYGGAVSSDDFFETANRVNDAVQSYAQLYQGQAQVWPSQEVEKSERGLPSLSVGEVVYSVMSDRDKLRELTTLVGKLRFAVEGMQQRQIEEAEAEMRVLAGHLPDAYRIARLIEATESSVERGSRLTELYLERCYKLCDEDYLSLREVENAIRELEESSEPPPKSSQD